MFKINKEDLSLHLTRGDDVVFSVQAMQGDKPYTFANGDVVTFKVSEAKYAGAVVLEETFTAIPGSDFVQLHLEGAKTKFGDVISKPVDYWYEISLTSNGGTQTIIGYDEQGAKVLRLYPELQKKE